MTSDIALVAVVSLPRDLDLDAVVQIRRDWPDHAARIVVRLHPEQWVHPVGLVSLACLIEASRRRGSTVVVDHANCQNAGYWERMGFFSVLNLEGSPPVGIRHEPKGRFCELRRVSDIDEVDSVTEALVAVADPTLDAWEVYNFIVSEALNNLCQHSGSIGFCHAQFYPSEELVRFCIADIGCGLRHALRAYGPPDDGAAILKAFEVGVTSGQTGMGTPGLRNRGVGLSAIRRLVLGNEGELAVWSGTGWYSESELSSRGELPPWQGTMLAATMKRNKLVIAFDDVMRDIGAELRAQERQRGRRPRVTRHL